MIEAIYLSMPLSTSTCLKAPPPPMINSIMAMILIEEVRVSLICSMERPRFKPKVNSAISTAIRVAMTGSPKNSAIGRKAWPFGRIISATARIAIRITGTSEVQTLTPKPHLFFSEHFRVMQAFRDRLINAFQESGENRAGENNRRDSQNGAVEQRFTHIGVEDGGDRGRTQVRRQEAMGDGERGGHRYADVQQRNTGRGGDGKHQRQHQHEAHLIEQGETDGEAGQTTAH